MTSRCTHTQDAPAWTLNALDEAESAEFGAHLDTCSHCQAAVEQLAPAAQILGMAAPQVSPPDALRDRIMGTVRAEAELLKASGAEADRPVVKADRKRGFLASMRPVLAGGMACVLLALGVAVGIAVDKRESDSPATKTFQAKVQGSARAVATVSGDRVTLHLAGMKQAPTGRVYQVWLRRGGQVVPTGTLFAPADGKATVTVDQGLHGADRVMITDEKMGGSQVPTTSPAVQAELT